jgi:hypothetical protein
MDHMNGFQIGDQDMSQYGFGQLDVQSNCNYVNWYPYCNCRSNAFEQVQDAILQKCRIAIESGNIAEANKVLDLAAQLKELKNG